MTYNQDFYETKEKEIDDLFLKYLAPIMEDIGHPTLIEEWIQNLDSDAYEKYIYKDVKLPSIRKKIDRNDKTEYWPKSIVESLNWLTLLDITEFTTDRIENDNNPLSSLFKIVTMFKIKCWWNLRKDEKKTNSRNVCYKM